jgi:hypothetical protein
VAFRSKVELRRRVLAAVAPARVFDAFCGLGRLFAEVWSQADAYVGCDARPWSPAESLPRFVADNRRVLRCIDLHAFNVFDFDAYGSSWEQLLILAARRTWARGERGAVVITDGDVMRFGLHAKTLAKMLGVEAGSNLGSGKDSTVVDLAIKRWCALARVTPEHTWGFASGIGKIFYRACVFSGAGRTSKERT